MRYHFLRFYAILCLCLAPLLSAKAQTIPNETTYKVDKILLTTIDSSINPATFNYLDNALKRAIKEDFNLVVIKMNTPGGLISTTKKILTLIGDSPLPFIVWVAPEGSSATSAGAIISSSAHILLMSEGTNIGAATPVQMGSKIKEDDLRDKAINDLVALVRSLSETRKRNPVPFELMITKAQSFTAKEALEKKVIDGIVNSEAQLLNFLNNKVIHIKGADSRLNISATPLIVEQEMDLGQVLLNIFANPSLAYLFFLIGAALIYLELQTPGGMIAGALGAVSLIIAAIGFQVLPLNLGALGLLALSFILFIMEVYITSYGILSLAGIASLVTGSLFLFRTNDSYIHLSGELIFSATSAIVLFLIFMAYIILRDQKNVGKKSFNKFVGLEGTIITSLGQEGEFYLYQVKVNGEFWKAQSPVQHNQGDKVVIKEQNTNMQLII